MNVEIVNRLARLRLDLEAAHARGDHLQAQVDQLVRHLDAAHRRGSERLERLTEATTERERMAGILQGIAADTERRVAAMHRRITTRLRDYGVPDHVIADALGVAVVGLPRG